MMPLGLAIRVFAMGVAVDMRRGFEGLWALATQELGHDVLGGDLFLFVGRDRKLLKVKTIPKRLARAVQSFTQWIKSVRNRKTTSAIWSEAAAKLTGHFRYYGVVCNEAKLSHFRWSCVGALFRWLNRRSQKPSFTWERFEQRLRFDPLPHPPCGPELIDVTSEHGATRNHKPKSRMPKLGTYGSVRSASLKLAFT